MYITDEDWEDYYEQARRIEEEDLPRTCTPILLPSVSVPDRECEESRGDHYDDHWVLSELSEHLENIKEGV